MCHERADTPAKSYILNYCILSETDPLTGAGINYRQTLMFYLNKFNKSQAK